MLAWDARDTDGYLLSRERQFFLSRTTSLKAFACTRRCHESNSKHGQHTCRFWGRRLQQLLTFGVIFQLYHLEQNHLLLDLFHLHFVESLYFIRRYSECIKAVLSSSPVSLCGPGTSLGLGSGGSTARSASEAWKNKYLTMCLVFVG